MSRQRNIRKKSLISFDAEEEGEGEQGSIALPPAARAAQAAREKQRKAEKKALLSFEDDGAGEEGAPAAAKPKLGKGSLRAPGVGAAPPPTDERAQRVYTQMASAGEYTADKLKELQKGVRSLPGSSKPGAPPAFKLSGSFKAAAPPKDDRFQYNVSAAGVVRATHDDPSLQRPSARRGGAAAGDMPLPPPSEPPPAPLGQPDAGAAAAAAQAAEEEEEDDIPDEEMIAWAKAKRERLRGVHLAPDYIPTDAAPPGLSRLRDKKKAEEEVLAGDSGSEGEAEAEVRMQFMGAPSAPPGRSAPGRPSRGGASAPTKGEDEGEEDERWAQEQIRKGMGGLAAPGASAPGSRPASAAAPGQGATAGGAAAALAAGGSQHAAIQAAAAEVLGALQAGLQRLQMSRKQADKNLERTANNLQGSLAALARLESELEAASAKYVLVQGLKAYVADLCNMLQASGGAGDKSPLVEELEEALLELCQGRAAAAERRRAAGDAEERPPAEAAVAAAAAVLSRGGALPAAAAAAEAAAEAAEEQQLGLDLPVELDEFGRDINAERKAELAARAKQRRQRLAALERVLEEQPAAGGGAPADPRFGEATSEESEGEVSHFNARQAEVQQAADAVFRDADDEFGSLGAVKRRLEEWKARQPGAYHDAYVSLSAPALFAPFVRLELLKWRPLHGSEAGFDSHDWYQQLFDYGMPQHPTDMDPSDPDANLVPQLVQKLVLPLARQLLEGVWSPCSRRQSRAAAAMLADLLVYVPAQDEGLQEVVRLVLGKLDAAVAALALPAWPPAALAASRRAAIHLAQRFGRGVRLLASVSAFEGSLPRGMLQRLALERLLAQQLLPYVRAALGTPAVAADRAARVAAVLPAEWFRGGAPRGGEGLLEVLATLARALEVRAASDGGAAAVNADAARQVSESLVRLGDVARANKLGKAFGIL